MKLRRTRFYHQSKHYKRHLIREAKSRPCIDCLAEGRRADWPLAAMTLDHLGEKTMEFTNSCRGRDIRGAKPSYLDFTVSQIRNELATCEPICAGHHNIRTRARQLVDCLDPDDIDDEPGEIQLF